MVANSKRGMCQRGPSRICVGASAGGHMTELLRLLAYADRWPCLPSVYITTGRQLVRNIQSRGEVECLADCNRKSPLKIVRVAWKALHIVVKHRPHVLITTGSLPLAIVAIWVRIFGGKVVWIDSIANMEELSMSGRLAYLFADLFITQWDELSLRNKRAKFFGQLI
jgi:exopolysaccharide biosynthesis glucuronosyltransferase PssD